MKNQEILNLAEQLNDRLAKNAYWPTKAEAKVIYSNGFYHIHVTSISATALHNLELCIDFVRFNGLSCYADMLEDKVTLVIF